LLSRLSAAVFGFFRNDYELRRMYKHCDFIGLNYYFNDRIYGYRIHNRNQDVSDLGWDMQPAHIQHVIEKIAVKTKLPVMITENGVADKDDDFRAWWISESMKGIKLAMKNGASVIGYLHWSLLDNFEWREGKWPRFGLVEVDYGTMKRTLRPSAKKFGAYIKKIRKESN